MNGPSPRIERHAPILRAGMLLLVIPQVIAGAWAFFAPRSWYDSFPGFGRVWVAPIGPFNEHFVSEVGNALLVMSLLVVIAAVYLERRLVRIALTLWLLFSIPHFISHLRLTSLFDAVDNAGNLAGLGIAVVLPIVLLLMTRESPEGQR